MNWPSALFCVAILIAQGKPNFSGHWELVRSGELRSGVAVSIDIVESAQPRRVLSVTRHFEGGDAEARDYPFGIRGTAGGILVGGGIPTPTSVQSVRWDDSAILIDQEGPEYPELHERWSIDTNGELVIESAEKPLVLATSSISVRYRKR